MTIEPSDTEPVVDEALPATRTAGKTLKEERIQQGLSEQLVADKLHITMHYVRAIESDNYEKLPGKVFAKGYVRSYALLLELNVDEIIKLYDEFCDFIDEEVEKQDRIVEARNKKDRLLPRLILAIVVLIAAILGFWIYIQFFSSTDTNPVESTYLTESNTNQVFALQVGGSDAIDLEVPMDASIVETGELLNLTEFKELRVVEVYNVGSDVLQISFKGECWVEVIDAGSTNIYREVQESGDLLRITGTAPFRILLGDAPFVEVKLNGQSVDVNGNIRIDKSARLVVGLL